MLAPTERRSGISGLLTLLRKTPHCVTRSSNQSMCCEAFIPVWGASMNRWHILRFVALQYRVLPSTVPAVRSARWAERSHLSGGRGAVERPPLSPDSCFTAGAPGKRSVVETIHDLGCRVVPHKVARKKAGSRVGCQARTDHPVAKHHVPAATTYIEDVRPGSLPALRTRDHTPDRRQTPGIRLAR